MAPNVKDLDLYGLLELQQDATQNEIKKAYRRKALKCHPDKNPDNPRAAEEWEKLSKALEVLTDKEARAAYDKVLKAKKAAELRNRALDAKRRKVKHDLEQREAAAKEEKEDEFEAAKKLEAEIKRLREEGSRQLEEEQELLNQQLKEEEKMKASQFETASTETPKLKVKWKSKKGDESNGGYSYDILHSIFSKYGDINNLLVSRKRNGSAIVEFVSSHSLSLAVENEIGIPANPLQIAWLSGKPGQGQRHCSSTTLSSDGGKTAATGEDFESLVMERLRKAAAERRNNETVTTATEHSHHQPGSRDREIPEWVESSTGSDPNLAKDYESITMMKMRQAEERKRLIEQMQNEDSEG
ncbi:dnaJ homolog subfamily C member 17-like [Ptychodera flava]|uniref:dnaJ homolog subfamily C member 17-like n=1 Tax=Ptychodera flava TaxID=63121 RepID=UPI00396AA566